MGTWKIRAVLASPRSVQYSTLPSHKRHPVAKLCIATLIVLPPFN